MTDPIFPNFRLTLRNYRGFSDQNPLQIDFRPGFTALVGPNNSGKSSLLRFFFEVRGVLVKAVYGDDIRQLLTPRGVPIELGGLEDPSEILTEQNARDISFDIEFPDAGELEVRRATFKAERENPRVWRVQLYVGPGESPVRLAENGVWRRADMPADSADALTLDRSAFDSALYALTQSVYAGPFRHVLRGGSGSHFDLSIGEGFVAEWNAWKTSADRRRSNRVLQITEDIRKLFGFRTLEINSADNNKSLQVVVDGRSSRLREWGAGLSQFITVLGNLAFKDPSIVLLDEPETNLHPSLQTDFLATVASYAKYGVFYATHSIGLARTMSDRIYSFQRCESGNLARVFEQTPRYAEFLGELSYASFRELGHDLVLLVEGVTEVRAVQQFLRLLGMDHRTVVIPLGGAQLIGSGTEYELQELKRLAGRVGVLIDSERANAGEPLAKEREQFVSVCRRLQFSVHVTERRAFENYLTDEAVRRVKGDKHSALAPFQRLKEVNPHWSKTENWRIAREMTREDLLATDLGRFLASLSKP
jgi:predicted ATPase